MTVSTRWECKYVSTKVFLVVYDPKWPDLYEREKNNVLQAAGEYIIEIKHVGSTSVPNLSAKPIIDMMAGVRDKSTATTVLDILQSHGYGFSDPKQDDWHYVMSRKDVEEDMGYHLHLITHGSWDWERHLLFRDYLRVNVSSREEYEILKMKLADKYRDDRPTYTASKSNFIRRIQRNSLTEKG